MSAYIPVSAPAATTSGMAVGANAVLGPMDIVATHLPGTSTFGATLAIWCSGTAFTGMSALGSLDGSQWLDVVDRVAGTKASITTASNQFHSLGMNYAHIKVVAAGGDTTSVLQAAILI